MNRRSFIQALGAAVIGAGLGLRSGMGSILDQPWRIPWRFQAKNFSWTEQHIDLNATARTGKTSAVVTFHEFLIQFDEHDRAVTDAVLNDSHQHACVLEKMLA